MTDYDTTEKVERTDRGYRLTIESTRGTGTRDQDKVSLELRREHRPESTEIDELCTDVTQAMNRRRKHQPDTEEDNE